MLTSLGGVQEETQHQSRVRGPVHWWAFKKSY